MKRLLFTTLLALFACFGIAQNKTEFTGNITDTETDSPLSGIFVQIIANTDTLWQYTTDNGIFSFKIPTTAEKIEFTASLLGFKTYHDFFILPIKDSIKIKLDIDSELLNEVVVVSQDRMLINSRGLGKINMSTDKLSQIPSLMGAPDIIKVLQLTPGVQNSGEANGYLYVRGADPGHNLMLYNNIPLYGMSHLLGIFPFYNADHITGIQFDKAGVNSQYGNRLSAILRAVTPEKLPEKFGVKGNIGLLASQLSVQVPLRKAGVYVSARRTYIDELLIPAINSIVKEDVEDLSYRFSDFNFTFLAEPSKKHHFSINAFFSGDKLAIQEQKMLVKGNMKWGNSALSATWKWKIKDEMSFNQTVYFSEYDNNLTINQTAIQLATESKVTEWGANSLLCFKLFGIPFETGLQLSKYNVYPQQITSTQFESSVTDNSIKAWQLAAFMQASISFNHSLSMDIGIRINDYFNTGSHKKNYFHAEPHLSLNYSPLYNLNAYIAYSRKNQYLNLITTSSVGFPTDYWIASTKEIPSQYANNLSIGSVYRPFTKIEITAGLFYSKLNRLIEYPYNILQFNEIENFDNDIYAGKGKAYGVELMIRKTGRLSGWLSYTLSRSERQFKEILDNEVFPAKFDRRHNLSFVANYEVSKKISAGFTQVYSSSSRFTVPTSWYLINNNPVKEYGKLNNAKMPDYIRTDISVDFFLKNTHKKESVINLSVYNMFAINNPIYVILDITAGNDKIKVYPRYKKLYSILPSISWRFKF